MSPAHGIGRVRAGHADPRAILRGLRPMAEDRPAFVVGLVLGAMVGAAIAGSTLWSRLRERRAASFDESAEHTKRLPPPSP